MSETTEIYTNTPENQEKFNEFWDSLEKVIKPLTCDQMIRKHISHLEQFYTDRDEISVYRVKEILMSCLRGC